MDIGFILGKPIEYWSLLIFLAVIIGAGTSDSPIQYKHHSRRGIRQDRIEKPLFDSVGKQSMIKAEALMVLTNSWYRKDTGH